MSKGRQSDSYFMGQAILEAKKAGLKDEVPIGAVVVKNGVIIARAHNLRITNCDGTAHAEILAIKKAGKRLKNWRLDDCVLYVTLEPCAMCAGALINSRVARLVFGASDERFGCCTSIYSLPTDQRFNHRLQVEGGVLAEQCAEILSAFFKLKREGKKVDNNLLTE